MSMGDGGLVVVANPSAPSAERSLTVSEWAGILRDPVRDQAYKVTGLGRSVPAFLTTLGFTGRSDATRDQYERDLARASLKYPDKTIGEWTPVMCEAALMDFPPGSRKRARAAMAGLFKLAWMRDEIPENPMLKVGELPRVNQKIVETFTDAEVASLCSLKDVRDRTLMVLLLGTGIRKGEARRLQRRHIKDELRQLLIFDGKGGKDRVIPLSTPVLTALMELVVLEGLDDDDYLWYGRRGGRHARITRSGPVGEAVFHRWWVRCLDEAYVTYRKPHTTRHTFATRALKRGARIERVSRVLGHSSVAITDQVYVHLVTEDLEDAVNRVEIPL